MFRGRERETQKLGRLPRTRGWGLVSGTRGWREGEGSVCRADRSLWCLLCPAAPERSRHNISGKEPLRMQMCSPGRGREGRTGQERFPDKRCPRPPCQPGWQLLQAQPCRPPAAGTWPSFGNCGWECRRGREPGRQDRLSLPVRSPLGARAPWPCLWPRDSYLWGRVFTLGGRTPGCDPLSPPGSSSAGAFRPGPALPAQAH